MKGEILGQQDVQKRWLKSNIYARSPLFWRALFYFLYRYVARSRILGWERGAYLSCAAGILVSLLCGCKNLGTQKQ